MTLAVLTSLFNCPKGSMRHRHYQTFRDNLGDVPVYTVELAFDDFPFLLQPGEDVLQLRSTTWMWQRDRIMNRLLEEVPTKYDNIAFIDADILFHNPNWQRDAENMLTECQVGQLWDICYHTDASIQPEKSISNRDKGVIHTGYAWVARRKFLDEFGMFDKCPVGGNDVMMTCAYCGWKSHPYFRHMNEAFMRYYRAWAEKVTAATRGDVGYLESNITHLWHGTKQKRDYIGRLSLINDFDPATDLKVGTNGCYEWATDKPEMHEGVKNYMKSRTDG